MTESIIPAPIRALRDAGVSIWLDDLSRERLTPGNLAELVATRAVVGVTTNPTIFAEALAHGEAYDDQLAQLARAGIDVDEAVFAITTADVRAAADVLRPVYEASGGVDGRVSIEVDPRLARDTEATLAMARRLWHAVDRPNLLVKIPATVEGLPAITRALAEGISVNVTLIFSLERYRSVMESFRAGLDLARKAGLDLASIASVASFFISRIDTAVDRLLDDIGDPAAAALRGTIAIANARLAFADCEDFHDSYAWTALATAGAHPQRPLWASTGVKDPAYPDTMYIDQLVTCGVVTTMPQQTLDAVADHGADGTDTIRGTARAARETLTALAELGIGLEQVTERLEIEGVAKFEASWAALGNSVRIGLERTRSL
jgi:transaldolase